MDAGRICPEDVVCLVSDPSMPGMVCCVGEDTENRHAQPSAHVYWLRENDNDRMEPISELRILDRALLHGDTGDSKIVRLVCFAFLESYNLSIWKEIADKFLLLLTEISVLSHGSKQCF
jgi:hypothetical protein